MELLKINGHDYSKFVESKGFGWSRNDLDSDKTTRTRDGNLRRVKITTKRKLTYKMLGMSRAQLAALDDDLSNSTFMATYLDMHGEQSREFYCSSFSASLVTLSGTTEKWEEAAFSMTEV